MIRPQNGKYPLTLTLMLTLDHSTLFYWTLSDKKRNPNQVVNEWASEVESQPAWGAPSHGTARSIPSLTTGTSHSSRAPSVFNNIKITGHGTLGSVKAKADPIPDAIAVHSDGGLSDNDETQGAEREAAIKSPPKGKK
jgi:hypothetical protein